MKAKVLILEDNERLLRLLTKGLERRDIRVIAATSVEQAWSLLESEGDIDVVVLDINLGEGVLGTGLDFGMKLKELRKDWPPEFLIYSVYDNTEYYQTALVLGAAAYLQKATIGGDTEQHPPKVELLAQHIRALTLRRALHAERPDMSPRLLKLVEKSDSGEKAIESFCREVFAPELESTLGSNFMLILSYVGGVTYIAGSRVSPPSSAWLERVQVAAHTIGNVEPLVVSAQDPYWLEGVLDAERDAMRKGLLAIDGAAFMPLWDAKPFRLSLGLVPTINPGATKDQVKLLDQYLQRPVIRHLFDITEIWSSLEHKRKLERQGREILLETTRDFCLYQGQELSTLVREAAREIGDLEVSTASFNKLQIVADEMRDAGELLNLLGTAEEQTATPSELEMNQLVARVWQRDISSRLSITNDDLLRVVGTCYATDQRERAERAVSQILGWLARRLTRRPLADSAKLIVECKVGDQAKVEVVFTESSSHRLPSDLRKSFFAPFYARGETEQPGDAPDKGKRLGLYLARALAELAGGALHDRSDELEGSKGHRLVLELPAAEIAA